MEKYFSNLPIIQTITFLLIGGLLYVLSYIVSNYLLPLLKKKDYIKTRIIQKTLIIFWVIYFILFLSSLIITNVVLSLFIILLVLGLGWPFFRNVFAGVFIKYNDKPKVDDYIVTAELSGKVSAVNWSHTEITNSDGDQINIPNKDLIKATITYQKNTDDLISFSYQYLAKNNEDYQSIYLLATNCPYFTSNQKVEVTKNNDQSYQITAFLIDKSFKERAILYFERNDK